MNKQRQLGSSLLVTLVFLTILTAAGIAAVTLSTSEEKMASNAQFRTAAYQGAYSEILANIAFLNRDATRIWPVRAFDQPLLQSGENGYDSRLPLKRQAITSGIPNYLANSAQAAGSNTKSLAYIGERPAEGSSLEKFYNYAFELNTRRTLNSGTYSDQVQGFNIQMPKP